ncbi:MAG TPA: hypothetical protein VER79_04845 [Candidatus Limnocylindrales bacterium]|nr:hypothetical protein [Candidatus Limnocylindrales bacterium]
MKATGLLALAVMLLAAACTGGPETAQRVTAIPPSELTASPSPQPTAVVVVVTDTPISAATGEASATPLPLDVNLAEGSAMQHASATDVALAPTPRSRLTFEESPVALRFAEFYDGYNMRTGLQLSDKLVSLDGQRVVMEGYMAPPLKPELDYFVLTRIRLSFCPFCSTAADWPDDIALIYLTEETTDATEHPVRISGRLEVGASVDQETGMVSLVRIYADTLELMQ